LAGPLLEERHLCRSPAGEIQRGRRNGWQQARTSPKGSAAAPRSGAAQSALAIGVCSEAARGPGGGQQRVQRAFAARARRRAATPAAAAPAGSCAGGRRQQPPMTQADARAGGGSGGGLLRPHRPLRAAVAGASSAQAAAATWCPCPGGRLPPRLMNPHPLPLLSRCPAASWAAPVRDWRQSGCGGSCSCTRSCPTSTLPSLSGCVGQHGPGHPGCGQAGATRGSGPGRGRSGAVEA
jgi:hypothetical protein